MKTDCRSFYEKLQRSKRVKKRYVDDKMAFIDMYTNRANDAKGRKDLMQVNYIYSHMRLVGPTIFAGNPKVNVRPRQTLPPLPALQTGSENLEGSIEYWVKELGVYEEFQSALQDSFFGDAVTEVGWDYKTEIREEMVPQPVDRKSVV